MTTTSLSRKHSIGTKIFAAFVATGLITGALGGYGFYVLSETGKAVVDTYDRPLMAINFARSASLTFMQMDKELLRRNIVPEGEKHEIDGRLDDLTDSFGEDLGIAEERSLGPDERKVIADIRQLVAQWSDLRTGSAVPDGASASAMDDIAEKIVDRFDVLTELTLDHSFIERRKAVWSISYFKYASIAVSVLALLVSAAITWLLARRIIRPLSAAAQVADRIAAGELQTEIPLSGRDETGTLLRSMKVMQDNIRQMMESEAAQRRSAQIRLIDALESSPEGMLLVDETGEIVLANSQIAKFFPSVASCFVAGANFATALCQLAPLLESAAQALMDLQRNDRFSTGEYLLTDGRWVRISRTNTHEGGFFLILSDFTEIKKREENYRRAQLLAEEASSAKSRFLANMSHELRTPLNAIIGFSEIISSQMFGKLNVPKYAEYAGNILSSGHHLLEIISDVLDLAKSEAGKLELSAEPVDLRRIFKECTTMMREQCARAQLQLSVPPSDVPALVRGEPAKLRQIFLNLLSNAVKFSPPGGAVSLTVGTVAAKEGVPGFWEVRVSDTGIGMSVPEIAIALAPFGQVDSSLSRRYPGTGLGLPLTKVFVELHGGTLLVESMPGKGTTVIVRLPTLPDEAPAEPEAEPVVAGV